MAARTLGTGCYGYKRGSVARNPTRRWTLDEPDDEAEEQVNGDADPVILIHADPKTVDDDAGGVSLVLLDTGLVADKRRDTGDCSGDRLYSAGR